jgi:bifunctional enzyme CysN/CysC
MTLRALKTDDDLSAHDTVAAAAETTAVLGQDLDSSLHVLTCGSVDDGKSTLIGRMLWDAAGVFSDQRDAISQQALTSAGTPDFSLLVDGLAAEREQGITIDIAWRYFELPTRRLVIIDSPGHVQYTRNMATGASHADVAVLLVDARAGIKEQTRRHAAILDLIGVRRIILAVNKMDLVGWSQDRFREIEAHFAAAMGRFGFVDALAIPLSAIHGDNVARRSRNMPWYDGPPLLEHLQMIPARVATAHEAFRFAVQLVVRDGQDFRGFAGTVASGQIVVGDAIRDGVSGRSSRIARIVTMGGDLAIAKAGQAVVLQLEDDIDVSRGAVLAHADADLSAVQRFAGRLVWLSDSPFDPDRGYLLRTATDLVPLNGIEVRALLDLETLSEQPALWLRTNDIGAVNLSLARPTALDLFAVLPRTGSFVLVDAATGDTVAGGVVDRIDDPADRDTRTRFKLTRALLRAGLCADLGDSPNDLTEFRRRAHEVALILAAAGVPVDLEDLNAEEAP